MKKHPHQNVSISAIYEIISTNQVKIDEMNTLLKAIQKNIKKNQKESPYVTPQEISIQMQIHIKTVYRHIKSKRLESKRIGRRVYVLRSSLKYAS
jgi:excisionase family DNA binding protein